MKKNRFGGRWATFFLTAGLFSTILISCKEDAADKVGQRTATDIVHENPEFSILKTILDLAALPDGLRTQDATFLLPDNAAFQKANIPSSVAANMTKTQAGQFLNSFIIKSLYDVDRDLPNDSLSTVSGKKVKFVKQGSTVNVNNAEITKKNVPAANGVIQIVDSVYVKVM
ncbi:Uncaracterized surface protein containing fasciclin (FAS1) repeats [Dyadobacter soli]|uniref:Uncaracterized surface protein containing fasciclin (FAS1) repeats n=1 Tax=Dyadobacter soli TaxID=659014 RepID=A0A1G7J7B5_9BACT|nr:fasciclin domain-containing protein [Dyadobacter soli]SDF20776.1 Uncaracterized surface protein containing fasciclin (FAS1) repeats [Dyadobacter soli]